MGGKGSGRKSSKLIAIECVLSIQMVLYQLSYHDLDSNMTRGELKEKVEEGLQKTRVAQEEIERSK
ncbi:MAG: hypothetical protein KAU12_00270 [Candidatus Omnitrophica bacterium]|nr:hypothetical protein [Candidatus Omnitrophota bacterium]